MTKASNSTSEFLEQLRPPVPRSAGLTESERYLAKLADRSFLDLWSYPNPYRDQKGPGITTGKEICDLLVVCHPHIIIFSEKTIKWPDKPLDIAWARWFRKAVWESVQQLRGAERWICNHPCRVFLDETCATPFPLEFPKPEVAQIHRVVVARGAADARIEQLKAGSGSLGIKPEVIGPAHFDTSNTAFAPFCIGDMDPEQNFVHVLDESSLEIILTELDTVKDFTDYLTRKEVFVRSRNLKKAEAEEDILAYYATHTDQSGEHDFVPTDGKTWEESGPIEIKAGLYNEYSNDPRYIAKKAADEESYAWDKIIQVFTRHVLGGTSLSLLGFDFDLQNSEKGLRYLALESRLSRRVLGSALLGALEKGKDTDRFFRLMFSAADPDVAETAYFALTVKHLDFMKESGGYNDYRAKRASLAALYGRKTLMDRSNLKRVVGIVVEPPGSDGGSEDLVLIEQQEWTDELRAEVETDCKDIGILQGSHQEHRYHAQEFPDDEFLQVRIGDEIITLLDPPFGEDPMSSMFAEPQTSNKNRKERRAEKARARKLRKK